MIITIIRNNSSFILRVKIESIIRYNISLVLLLHKKIQLAKYLCLRTTCLKRENLISSYEQSCVDYTIIMIQSCSAI